MLQIKENPSTSKEFKKVIGIFAGGFKPPTKGHFEVVK